MPIGALGELLGQRGINISRMQVGVADGKQFAIAVLAVSKGLDADALAAIEQIEAVDKVLQISL
jgi:acetolactate synthase small subunit